MKNLIIALSLFAVSAPAETIECKDSYLGEVRVDITHVQSTVYDVRATITGVKLALPGIPGMVA